jgi:oligosaccharide repeat unit polymerase
MSVFVSALAVLTMLFALLTNRDMFSPGKFYLLSFLLFYLGALKSADNYELWMLILLVLMIGIATVCFEVRSSAEPATHRAPSARHERPQQRNVALWIWLASLPAIGAQIYIVQLFGGIQGYINVIGDRVIELRGLGPAKTLVSTVVVLSLVYFSVGLTRSRSMLWWILYAMHVAIVLIAGALSGSRGSILTVFATQVFVYHYIRRPVKMAYAVPIGAALLVFAMIIGVLRQGIKLEDSGVSSGLDSPDQVLALSTFNLGVVPLQILLNADDVQLADGSTLLSTVTNVVPRSWWPEKPDTGGVFFTKKYTGDAWDGASNLTPTFLGEGVINFGWVGGLAFFVVASLLLMYFVVSYYKKTLVKLRRAIDPGIAIDVVIYILVMWGMVGLMVGEITNTIQTLVTTQLIPALVFKMFLCKKHLSPFTADRKMDSSAPVH